MKSELKYVRINTNREYQVSLGFEQIEAKPHKHYWTDRNIKISKEDVRFKTITFWVTEGYGECV